MVESIDQKIKRDEIGRAIKEIEHHLANEDYIQAHGISLALPEGELRNTVLAHYAIRVADAYLGDGKNAIHEPDARKMAKALIERVKKESGYFG